MQYPRTAQRLITPAVHLTLQRLAHKEQLACKILIHIVVFASQALIMERDTTGWDTKMSRTAFKNARRPTFRTRGRLGSNSDTPHLSQRVPFVSSPSSSPLCKPSVVTAFDENKADNNGEFNEDDNHVIGTLNITIEWPTSVKKRSHCFFTVHASDALPAKRHWR